MQIDEGMKKYDVFISSKSEDYPMAEEVYGFLIQNGYSVFLASKELERIGDSEYSKAIDDALDECTHLIVVSSKLEYIKSKWVRYEWGIFCDDKKSGYRNGNLLTILDKAIAIAKLPPGLRHQQSFTFDNYLHEILGYLKKEEESALEPDKNDTESEVSTTIADTTSHTNDGPFIEKDQPSLMSEETTAMEHERVVCGNQQIASDPLPCNYQPSFPSVFSRFWLFDMAFANLAGQSREGSDHGFISLLASECLDLLEFLFLYAEHPDLEIRRVSLREVFSCIEGDNTLARQNLAAVLNQDINRLPSYCRDTDIFLFLFRKQVIGGTSPLTLVFTSPQCKSIFQSFPDDFWGIKGQKLFKESASFGERGEQFQEYMIRLLGVYRRDNSLFEYVRSQFDGKNTRMLDAVSREDPQSLLSQIRLMYSPIRDDQGYEVLIPTENNHDLPLGMIQAEQMISTEYCIRPTLPESPYRTKNGSLINLPTPLVLSETGITGIHYIKNRSWKSTIQFDRDVSIIPLDERVLPNTFFKYPYLVAGDFFEDRIIELDFETNRDHFFLIEDAGNTFLPPVKPLYFRYFTLHDLHHQMRCRIDDNNNVEVTLDIPVRGSDSVQVISLHRTYDYHHDEIVSIDDSDFRLSVWPTYRLPKEELNNYSVSVGGCRTNNNVRTRFVRLDSFGEDIMVEWHQIEDVRFCEVRYFDAIQLSVKDTEALLFPQFKEIGNVYYPIRVGIDMGSSSTRISYCDYGNFLQRLDIHPGQVMNLNIAHNDIPCWRSELTEMRMVQGEGIKEFALPPYLPPYEHSRLYTGLMHAVDFEHSDAAISFCNQLVWILKNRIVEQYGNYDKSTVYITLPGCISAAKTAKILNCWKEAFRHHFRDDIIIEGVDGNLSRLHSFRSAMYIPPYPLLILDIGKYYTDVALFDAEQDSMLSNTYPIGIGNIWESEVLDYQSNSKLFRLWIHELKYGSKNEQSFMAEVEKRMQRHTAWMDFLFSNMPEYSWSAQRKLFDSSPDLRGFCFFFLAAIIWKVVREIELKTEKKPTEIRLSGGGSRPFLCFMGEQDLEASVVSLFSYFSQGHQRIMKACYVDGTFAKAEGALLLDNLEHWPMVSPLCDIQNGVRYEEININAITDEFLSFVQALRQFDTTGLPLQLSHICDLFEQNAHFGARLLQKQYRKDYAYVNNAFFWPLKGVIPDVIREII
jgi:hypothetical protein